MREVGVLEAKTTLSALLSEVEKTREPVVITRNGRRVARISPEIPSPKDWKAIVDEILLAGDELVARNPKAAEPYDLREDRDAIE